MLAAALAIATAAGCAGGAGEQRIREVLAQHGAGPPVVDGVLRTVAP